MKLVRLRGDMGIELPHPRHMPCPECGASVERDADHSCDRDRWVDYNVSRLRPELDRLEHEVGAYLDTPQGRFEAWYAERRRDAA
jgi:hypothetical protein